MTDWKEYRLGDIATITTGFPFKGKNYSDKGIRVVRGENVTIGDLRWDTIKCWDEDFAQFEKYSLQEGDIVIGMDGSRVGKNRSQIRKQDLPLLLAQRVACVRAKPGYSQDLLAYLIKSPKFENYVSLVQTGTSIPHISQKQIEDFSVNIIENFITQTAIAEILSSLDDKIELNNQINRELEALAQALFKQWFVDFEFPDENREPYKSSGGEMVESALGEIPLGWEVGTVFDLFELQRGHDLPTSSRIAGNIPVFSASGFHGFHNEVKVLAPGITTGRSGVIGKVFLVLDDFWPLNTSLFVKKFKKATPYYTYFFLQSIDLQSLNGGSAVPTLNRNDVHSINCIIPESSLIEIFTKAIADNYSLIKKNEMENEKLISLRDALLPKLISGELEVNLNS